MDDAEDVLDYQDSASTRPPEGRQLFQWLFIVMAGFGAFCLILFFVGIFSPSQPTTSPSVQELDGPQRAALDASLKRLVAEQLEPLRGEVVGEFGYDVKDSVVHLTGAVGDPKYIERLASAAHSVRGVTNVETTAIEVRGTNPPT